MVPPHFYRELTRTTEGCKLLHDKGHFGEFVQTVRTHGLEQDDHEIITKVKGCLWAIGNVGSMELGAPFIEESQVVEVIIGIAERSAVLSMRGTAFFVLGLISRSLHGSEMLDACGWDGATTTMGVSLGRYIPLDLGRLLSVPLYPKVDYWGMMLTTSEQLPPWPYDPGESVTPRRVSLPDDSHQVTDATAARIIQLVVDLGNTVLTKRAVSDLLQYGFILDIISNFSN